MNPPDPFESKLSSLPARPLPPEWRSAILGAAAARPLPKAPPRWLLCGWGAAIAASVLFHFGTHQETPSPALSEQPSATLRRRAEILTTWLTLNEPPTYSQP